MTAPLEKTLAAVAWAGVLLLFWSAAMWTPLHDWNGARFYPAYLLADGQPIYHMRGGVVNGWIYGPMLPLLLVPCTWIADASWAMVAAAWCNLATLFLPPLIIFNYVLRDVPLGRRILLNAGVVGALLIVPTTGSRLVFITADQLAIGLGCLSCLALHHAQRARSHASLPWLSGAALLATAACWTKQTEALLPVAQLGFLCWRRSWQTAARYAGVLAVAQIGVALGLMAWFGASALWFNLAWIPSHHPFAAGHGNLLQRGAWLTAYVAPLALIFYLARRSVQHHAPSGESDGPLLADQLCAVGAGLLPFGLLAAAKSGGDENSFHSLYYFALAAIVCLAIRARNRFDARFDRRIAWVCVASVAAGVFFAQGDAPTRLTPAPQLRQALSIARNSPGRIVFPRNPLVTWLTERRQYHLEWGVYDQVLAGVPLSREGFWRGMPPDLVRAVYPVPGTYFFMQLFPPVVSQVRAFDSITIYSFARDDRIASPSPGSDHE